MNAPARVRHVHPSHLLFPPIFPYVHAPAHASRTLRIVLDAAGARAGTYEERGGRTSAQVVGVGTVTEHVVLSHR